MTRKPTLILLTYINLNLSNKKVGGEGQKQVKDLQTESFYTQEVTTPSGAVGYKVYDRYDFDPTWSGFKKDIEYFCWEVARGTSPRGDIVCFLYYGKDRTKLKGIYRVRIAGVRITYFTLTQTNFVNFIKNEGVLEKIEQRSGRSEKPLSTGKKRKNKKKKNIALMGSQVTPYDASDPNIKLKAKLVIPPEKLAEIKAAEDEKANKERIEYVDNILSEDAKKQFNARRDEIYAEADKKIDADESIPDADKPKMKKKARRQIRSALIRKANYLQEIGQLPTITNEDVDAYKQRKKAAANAKRAATRAAKKAASQPVEKPARKRKSKGRKSKNPIDYQAESARMNAIFEQTNPEYANSQLPNLPDTL